MEDLVTLALEGLDAPETEKAHGALDERVRPAAGVSECALSLSLNRPPEGLSCKKRWMRSHHVRHSAGRLSSAVLSESFVGGPITDSMSARALASLLASPPKTALRFSRSLLREMNCFIALLTASMLDRVSTSAFIVFTALPCAASSFVIDAMSRSMSTSTSSTVVIATTSFEGLAMGGD